MTTIDAALTDERTWRPANLDEFVGQSALKSTLGLMLQSASMRGAALEHVAFFGPQGWVKPPWPTSYPMRSAVGCESFPLRRSPSRAIWLPC